MILNYNDFKELTNLEIEEIKYNLLVNKLEQKLINHGVNLEVIKADKKIQMLVANTLIEIITIEEKKNISSESVGSWHVSYRNASPQDEKNRVIKELVQDIKLFNSSVFIIY